MARIAIEQDLCKGVSCVCLFVQQGLLSSRTDTTSRVITLLALMWEKGSMYRLCPMCPDLPRCGHRDLCKPPQSPFDASLDQGKRKSDTQLYGDDVLSSRPWRPSRYRPEKRYAPAPKVEEGRTLWSEPGRHLWQFQSVCSWSHSRYYEVRPNEVCKSV